ncbi:Rhs element protein [Shigella sonnei]|nr:Rhs element protein [Shigella sonnei]
MLTGHPQANLNREWQVVASELHGEQPQAVPGRSGSGTTLNNHFAVIPADRTWRPQPLLKPLVDGASAGEPEPGMAGGGERSSRRTAAGGTGTQGFRHHAGEPFCGNPGRQNMAATAVDETAGGWPAERRRDGTGRRGNLL